VSYLADGSVVSEMAVTGPCRSSAYDGRFVRNPDDCLALVYQLGSTNSTSSALLTPQTSVTNGLSTDELWSDYQTGASLPADFIPAASSATTGVSSFCSPLQSARGAKRRAMSSSTLSSDVPPDIISMIRYSPTEIPVFCGASGSGRVTTSSSIQLGRPGSGSISHLSARTNVSPTSAAVRARHQLETTAVDDLDNPLSAVIAMYHLEDQDDAGWESLDFNHVVVRQNDNFLGGCVDAAGNQPAATSSFAEFCREFTGEIPIPSSGQELDELEQLERFLQISAAVDDDDDDDDDGSRLCRPPSYGVAVASDNVNAFGHDPSSVVDRASSVEHNTDVPLVCLWLDCGHLFWTQDQLVQHIEQHVDQRCDAPTAPLADEFVCYWNGCSRQRRPFNARYKLLIHMRVHSGEKPHKCTVPLHHYYICSILSVCLSGRLVID